MDSWDNRPKEIAYLLNPSFCGEILYHTIKEYAVKTSNPLPYPLLFLVLPIVLHRNTRSKINRERKLHTWLQDNPEVKIGYASRAKQLVPITKEAINFLLQVEAIDIDENAGVTIISHKRHKKANTCSEEVEDCYKKAKIFGRWLANSGTTATTYIMWGVKP
jgi:hypothetical protein